MAKALFLGVLGVLAITGYYFYPNLKNYLSEQKMVDLEFENQKNNENYFKFKLGDKNIVMPSSYLGYGEAYSSAGFSIYLDMDSLTPYVDHGNKIKIFIKPQYILSEKIENFTDWPMLDSKNNEFISEASDFYKKFEMKNINYLFSFDKRDYLMSKDKNTLIVCSSYDSILPTLGCNITHRSTFYNTEIRMTIDSRNIKVFSKFYTKIEGFFKSYLV